MAPADDGDNGWVEWKHYVLLALKRNDGDHQQMQDTLLRVEKSIVALKIKSGVWGIIGGAVPVVALLAIWLIKSL